MHFLKCEFTCSWTPSSVTNCHTFYIGPPPPRAWSTYFTDSPCQEYIPVSTGILPHSLPEWAFRARPGLWRNCLCPKVARIAEQKFANRYRAKLGQTSSFPNGPQIWFPIGQ